MRILIKANIDTYNDIIAEVKQLDDITLELTLYRDGEAFDVTGQTISLRVRRTDGAIIEQTTMIDINKNVVTIEVKNICFAVAGNVEMELNLVDVKGSISTSTFYIAVGNIVLNEEILPKSDIGILNEAKELEPVRQKAENIRITNESTRVTSENIRISNENARKNNEISRQQAETNRVDVFNHNENERKNIFDINENSRKNSFETNEVNRQNTFNNNEAIRKANEDTRLSNENERKKAETIRLSNENTRVNAETNRVSDENKRVADENKRVSTEIARVNSESARVSAETTRNTNENNRVTAENNRVNAESNRVIAENNRQLEVTKAREDYFHVQHEDLYKRLYEDFKKVWLEFQNASLLSYEGNYITANNTLLGNTDSLILKGKTLQNLFKLSDKTPTWNSVEPKFMVNDICIDNNICTQKTYTIYNFSNKNITIYICKKSTNAYSTGFTIQASDLYTYTLNDDECFKMLIGKATDGWINTTEDMSLLKQSVICLAGTQSCIPSSYFEGIKSVEGNLNVKSCGKNLFDYKKILNNFPCEIVTEEGRTCLKLTTSKEINSIKLLGRGKPNTQYTMKSCTKRGTTELPGGGLSFVVNYTDGTKSYMVGTNQNTFTERIDTTTANKTVESIYCTFANLNIPSLFDINVGQLEESTTATEFEPYIEDKITINQTLRGNSNVQDILSSKGILTRRWGSRPYQTGDELLNNVFTDKITTYYQLATPVTENINFRNLNSYKGITNIITDGTLIQPLISTKIPSNVQAVVSSLSAENTSLNNQVSTLNLENTQLKSQNTEQQVNIDNLNDVTNTLIKSSL